jgi:hypothetical protein
VAIRSTRASAAVARLNRRTEGTHYQLVVTGDGMFILRQQLGTESRELTPALDLDAFVGAVDALGPQTPVRRSRSDTEFARQLVRKR